MASWFPVSQLLLVAVLSWNALCFPTNFDWKSNYDLSKVAPAPPSDPSHPAVSYMHTPVGEQNNFSPLDYSTFESSPYTYSVAAPVSMYPMDTSFSMSRASEPVAAFQPGMLKHHDGNLEYGNSDWEEDQLVPELPGPPPPDPGYAYQAGELFHHESTFEDGYNEQETEPQGYSPQSFYTDYVPSAEEKGADIFPPIVPLGLDPQPGIFGLYDQYFTFLTGQIPPGTLTHFSSDYENGRNYRHEVHYEGSQYPAQDKVLPPQVYGSQGYTLHWQHPSSLKNSF